MAAELLPGAAREHIARLWPKHLEHLAPEGNRMGQGHIDPDEGVVCNCGEVLGFPTVQDEADYVAEESEQPDTSGVQSGEPDDEPDWTPQLAERENYQDPDMLEDLEASGSPDEPEFDPDGTQIMHDMQELIGDVAAGRRIEREPDRADLTAPEDEAQADVRGHSASSTRSEPGWVDGAWSPADEAQARRDWAGNHDPQTDASTEPAEPKGVMPYRDPGVVEMQDPLAARVVVIDPSQPYTPQDVEQQLLDIAARLERGMHYQRYWEERAFAAKSEYTLKAARARLEATGAKDQRDAYVTVKCEPEWRELELADAMVRSMRETMHTLRSLQTGYQTVARSVAESMRVPAGSRGRP
jgi:hypothetical protein